MGTFNNNVEQPVCGQTPVRQQSGGLRTRRNCVAFAVASALLLAASPYGFAEEEHDGDAERSYVHEHDESQNRDSREIDREQAGGDGQVEGSDGGAVDGSNGGDTADGGSGDSGTTDGGTGDGGTTDGGTADGGSGTGGTGTTGDGTTTSGSTLTISPPSDMSTFLPGPNVSLVREACTECHSADYVSSQPPLDQAGWAKEVDKMVNTFGADDVGGTSQQALIIDYLVQTYGQ